MISEGIVQFQAAEHVCKATNSQNYLDGGLSSAIVLANRTIG